jgi:phage terminase large subunit-like protein
VGKWERLARERHARDLALAAQPGGHPKGLWFDLEAGDRVVQFLEEYCSHYEGEWRGQKVKLEEWQGELLRILFGWKQANGTRRFRTAYIELGRKNGKSFLCSGLALYLLVADLEPGAQVYSSATKEDQAAIVWRGSSEMVKASKKLQRFVKEMRSKGGRLVVEKSGSFFRPLGADSGTLDGLNPHGNVVDELHAHKDRRVWDVLVTAMGARRQPLTIAITTAGVYDELAIGWQQHDYACKVLDGTFEDDRFFAFVCAIDEGDDPYDPAVWGKANPNLGISCKEDELASQAETAKKQPSFSNEFFRLRLNRWTQQQQRWIGVEKWVACDPVVASREQSEEREAELAGRDCYGGMDLSTTDDIAALVLCFPLADGSVELVPRFYLPEDTVRAATESGKGYYREWADAGWLLTTPGNVVDYAFIRRDVNELAQRYRIIELAYDPWNAKQLTGELLEDGVKMVEVTQNFGNLSEPTKELEKRVVSKRVRHGGHPILRWMVSNAVVKSDAESNIRLVKPKKNSPLKVDGVQAAVMSLGRLIVHGPDGGSYLETQPLVTL